MRKHTQPPNFETALTELESTVQLMESANLPLDQALAAYARGSALLQLCREALEQAEQQVRLLDAAQQPTAYQEAP